MQLLSLYYDGKLLSLVLLGLQLVSIYFGPETISGRKRDRNFGQEFVSIYFSTGNIRWLRSEYISYQRRHASSLYIKSRDHFFSNCNIIVICIVLTTIIIIRSWLLSSFSCFTNRYVRSINHHHYFSSIWTFLSSMMDAILYYYFIDEYVIMIIQWLVYSLRYIHRQCSSIVFIDRYYFVDEQSDLLSIMDAIIIILLVNQLPLSFRLIIISIHW